MPGERDSFLSPLVKVVIRWWGAFCWLAMAGWCWGALPTQVAGILGLAQSPGTREIYAISGEPGGLYRSTDEGLTWIHSALDLPNTWFSSLAIAPDGSVYAVCSDGIFHSVDKGRQWRRVASGDNFFFLLPLANNVLLARSWETGLLRSADGGKTWQRIALSPSPVFSLAKDTQGVVWAATFGNGAYRSRDGGVSWEGVGPTGGHTLSLATERDGTVRVGSYRGGVQRWREGNGWSASGLGEGISVSLLTTTPLGWVAGGAGGELYLADGGGRWSKLVGAPQSTKEITGVLPGANGNLLVATRPEGLFQVDPKTGRWLPIPLHRAVSGVMADGQGGGYAVLPDNRLFHAPGNRSIGDLGVSWESAGYLPSQTTTLLATQGGKLLAGGYQGLHLLRDNHWQQLALPVGVSRITCLVEGTNQVLLAGTANHGLFRSTDGGGHWTGVVSSLPVTVCAGVKERIYALTSKHLMVSLDNGLTWIRHSLESNPVDLAVDGEQELIVATASGLQILGGGIFSSVFLEGAPITTRQVRHLAVTGNHLYLAGERGIDLFQRNGAGWRWQGQVLPRIPITSLAPLTGGWAAAATDQGLFILRGAEYLAQVPVSK